MENWFYSDPLYEFWDEFSVYTPELDDSWSSSFEERDVKPSTYPDYSLYSVVMHQSSATYKIKASRTTLYKLIRDFGSLLSFTLRFTYMAI